MAASIIEATITARRPFESDSVAARTIAGAIAAVPSETASEAPAASTPKTRDSVGSTGCGQ